MGINDGTKNPVTFIPHYNVGTGTLTAVFMTQCTSGGSSSGSEPITIRVSDVLRSLSGGNPRPTWTITENSGLTHTITGNGKTAPESVHITYTTPAEWAGTYVALITLTANDGVTSFPVQIAVLLFDTDTL